jgi:tetratricopeptide (TPR) repeat protein
MRADQISPVLSARCSLALVENDRDAVGICKKENAAVEKNASHTAMESFSAHDELGVALLRFGNNPVQAIKEFDQAMQLAPQGLNPSDGEWGQLYWHRATARLELKQFDEASQDFDVAEKSYSEAAASSGIASYRDTLSQIAKQHASLLNAQGKHDEAEAVLKKTAQ